MSKEDYTYEPEPGSAIARVVDIDSRRDPISLQHETFAKIATKPVPKSAEKVLLAPVNPEKEIDILPTGEIYMAQVHVRRRLNKAFGPMGWAMRPLTVETPNVEINQMYQRYALVAAGRVVAVAVGSAKYYPKNRAGTKANFRMDYADVAESVKSNALTRCCKDLGIGSECWDRRFSLEWKNKYAVHVWVAEKDRDDKTRTISVDQWRRIDAEPFKNEIEPIKDSPNQEAWRRQMEAWIATVNAEHAKTREMRKRVADAKEKARENDKAANVAAPAPPMQETAAQADAGIKPAGNQAGARPSTSHAPSAVNIDDKPFLIRECKVQAKGKHADQTPWTLYRITMMNGMEYFTFSERVYGDMQRHFAARDRIRIAFETKKVGGKVSKQVTEWEVMLKS